MARPAAPRRALAVGCVLAACLAKLTVAVPVAAPAQPAAVAPVADERTATTTTVTSTIAAPLPPFRGPAAPATASREAPPPGPSPGGRLTAAGPGPARAVDVPLRAELAAPGPEPALVDEHRLAAAHHLGGQPALDAALALLRDAQRDASLGLGAHLHALGVEEVKDVILDPAKIASLAAPLAAELNSALASSPTSAVAQRRISLIQAILAALQVLEQPGGAEAGALHPPLPDAEPAKPGQPLAQVTPHKKPVFSDSYLPALVQVLSHLVDLVEEYEQEVAAAVTETPATEEPVTSSTPTSSDEQQPGPATETIELTVVGASSESDQDQIVIQGPLQGIVGLLQTVASSIHQHTNPAHVVITEANTEEVNKEEEDDKEEDDKEEAHTEETHKEEAHTEDDDEDDGNNAPVAVVQSDVPIVNEETVPMMMMINMVPSDAPEMVMDMVADDIVEVTVTTVTPPDGDLVKTDAKHKHSQLEDADADDAPTYTPEEIRNFVSHPGYRRDFDADDSGTLEDILESSEFEDLRDNAFLVNGIRGEAAAVGKAHKRAPPSAPLLKLVKLRFALSAEAKRQGYKNIQGYSDAVLADLVKSSAMTSREQLGALLTTVQDRGEIKSPKTKANAAKVLQELIIEDSPLSEKLKGIPALKFAP